MLSPKPQRHCSGNVPACASLGSVSAIVALGIALFVATSSGCARRAYTDVYVENMASEIRDLEDQLYEFDSEYRVLEQELDALHAENARLRSTLATGGSSSTSAAPKNGSTQPRLLPVPGSRPAAPGNTAPNTAPNVAPGTAPRAAPDTTPRIQPSPAPSLDAAPGRGSPTPTTPPPSQPGSGSGDPYDIENLTPPTIEQGESMPPSLPPAHTDPSTPLTSSNPSELEIELGQIPLPAQLASATEGESSIRSPDRLEPAAEMPADTRVAEINFHPSLCRAVDLDQQHGDDGVYLVLQPLNEGREFVPLPGDLLIVAIDPAREGAAARIGRWSIPSSEAEAKLQPIGSSQGIHLSLPWTGGDPQADRVIVFVRYTMADGRQIVGEHTVMVNDARRPNTVWVPRAKANMPGSNVRTASGERPVR